MQIKFKDGKPVVTLTVNEKKTLANGLGVLKELARYPETYKTAGDAVKALGPIVGEPEAK